MNPARRREAAARALRRARDRMNGNGTHWAKGFMRIRRRIDNRLVTCWCAVGGIDSVTRSSEVRGAACVALAETIKPARMRRARKKHEDNARLYGYGESYVQNRVAESAREIIFPWNDTPKRVWKDVDAAFIKAAERLEEAS